MVFKTWLIVAVALLAIVTADPAGKEPQKEVASNTESKPSQTKQKRQNNFELKDMVVYLTPTQIKAIESGKAVLEPEYTYAGPSSQNQPQQQERFNEKDLLQQKDQIQNSLHQEGQQIQREIENLESNKKARLQLQEAIQSAKDLKQNEPTYLQEEQKSQLYQEYQQRFEQESIQLLQEGSRQKQNQQIQIQSTPQFEQQPSGYPQPISDNYAFQYSYPEGKQLNSDNLHLFFPTAQQPKVNDQILDQNLQQDTSKESTLSPKFHFIPYKYNPRSQLEAQAILESQWASLATQKLNDHRSEAQETESQQLKEVKQQLNSAQIIAAQHQDETQRLQAVAHQLEADQYDAIRQHSEKVKALQNKAIQQIKDFQKHIKVQDKQLENQQKEAQKLDEALEKEEFKTEVAKAEDKYFGSLRNQESEKNQYFTIFAPLLRHEQIKESFKPEKNYLLNYPKFEGGFKPIEPNHKSNDNDNDQRLEYAPSYNEDKFSKVLKTSLQKNEYEKAKAIARAEAILRERPLLVHQELKVSNRPSEVVKHVNVPVPQPFYVPLPSPFEVKVPKPYPLEIIRHVPVPNVKTEKIEVEKPVPIEVEKRVPVTKNVYIPVDKPYFVERIVPVEVKKEIPVEKVAHRPQKYTVIKHIW